ncbi:Hypothetical protein (Fragment) [Durusdinium trenchii]|uniref:Uncharacterized protein n=1 Tax=Durusdinium trenchii TaxID=1381693 RepID=A0ABP0Q576_9DINO
MQRTRATHLQLEDGEQRPSAQFWWRWRRWLDALASPLSLPGHPPEGPAEEAVRRVFQGLAQEAVEKREQRRAMGIQVRGPRANREALYFAPQRASWEQSIRSFLERSPAAEGCDLVQLERLAALQHFLEVDIADLHLPPEQRCSEDEYLEAAPLQDVCSQFLMDVTRGVYIIEGQRFDFEEVLEQSGLRIEDEPLRVEELKENFSQKVAAEIRQRLRQSPAGKTAESEAGYNVLVRGATSLLSQSGLANLERACDARVVVGGGDQELIFELKPCENEAAWDFLLCCEKMNFENFMVAGPDGSNQFFQCGTGSRIFRSTQIRLTVEPKYPPVSIEVLELRSEMDLLDELYQPIAWEPVQDRRLAFRVSSINLVRALAALPFRLLRSCWAKAQQTFRAPERSEGELPLYEAGLELPER